MTKLSSSESLYRNTVLQHLSNDQPVSEKVVRTAFQYHLKTVPEETDLVFQKFLQYFQDDIYTLSRLLPEVLETENYTLFRVFIKYGANVEHVSQELLRCAVVSLHSETALKFLLQNGLTASSDGYQMFDRCVQEDSRSLLKVFFHITSTLSLVTRALEGALRTRNLELCEYCIAMFGITQVPTSLHQKYVQLVMSKHK